MTDPERLGEYLHYHRLLHAAAGNDSVDPEQVAALVTQRFLAGEQLTPEQNHMLNERFNDDPSTWADLP